MRLFNLGQKEKLESIKELPFKLEKEIQKISEENLETIFRLYFVKSEFTLNNFRIDSLAFDKETQSFVIVEYKRDKNFSVIDQGYAYLSLMPNNKGKTAEKIVLEFVINNVPLSKKVNGNNSQEAEERFARHFGAINSGDSRSADNEKIDADLIRLLEDTHDDE